MYPESQTPGLCGLNRWFILRGRKKRLKTLKYTLPALFCLLIVFIAISTLTTTFRKLQKNRNSSIFSIYPTKTQRSQQFSSIKRDQFKVPFFALDRTLSNSVEEVLIRSKRQTSRTETTTLSPSTLLSEEISEDEEEPTNSNFPPDLFTRAQRRKGAVIFHIIGVVYMFIALAVVCDEFFIPALDVITQTLAISEDVAGATFMAAGGSAPELFTSLIGVFISLDDVGVGTIVGSAVFNILFVISMCAIFAKTVLQLTWWPLFRDVSFYSLILLTLMKCFNDSHIEWWESTIMLCWYAAYVTFMKYNECIELAVKRRLYANRVTAQSEPPEASQTTPDVITEDGPSFPLPPKDSLHSMHNIPINRKMSVPILHGGSSKFRQGVLQLMINSVDPLHDEIAMRKHVQMAHSVHKQQQLPQLTESGMIGHCQHLAPGSPENTICVLCLEAQKTGTQLSSTGDLSGTIQADGTVIGGSLVNQLSGGETLGSQPKSLNGTSAVWAVNGGMSLYEMAQKRASLASIPEQEIAAHPVYPAEAKLSLESGGEGEEPLDISWPRTWNKRITYMLLFPITIVLFLTLPDVRRQGKRKYFIVTFVGSILWIAFFSYLMVWWASVTGITVGISPDIMGLTFLAAGTSIPDLITSVLVARKGFGDMAVSSSVGSNIFDVCVGLPLPWLIYSLIYGQSVLVNSANMGFSIMLLFIMLLFVIFAIALFKWRLNMGIAVVMFGLYFVFIIISTLL